MRRRQHAQPRLVESDGARDLFRVPFNDRGVDEAWLQRLLFASPSLLPVLEIEAAFAPLKPVTRELRTDAGPIDLLFVSPTGYLTVVETKLVRNPEARRQVVAQLLDYAKELARWTYDGLVDAIRRSREAGSSDGRDPLLEAVQTPDAGEDETDPVQFRRTVEQGLRRGRFLLLIVGDEIHEDVEWIVDYLQHHAHLQFTMGLVSLDLYRLKPDSDWPLLVVPRIIARTTEIVRAIVRIEGGEGLLKPPVVTVPTGNSSTSPSWEAFLEAIRGKPDGGALENVEGLRAELEKLGLEVVPMPTGAKIAFPDPAGTDTEFRILRFTNEGRIVSLSRLKLQLEREGYSGDIALRYAEAIARWIPEAHVNPGTGNVDVGSSKNCPFPIKVISEAHRDQYLKLVRETIDAIRVAAQAKKNRPV